MLRASGVAGTPQHFDSIAGAPEQLLGAFSGDGGADRLCLPRRHLIFQITVIRGTGCPLLKIQKSVNGQQRRRRN